MIGSFFPRCLPWACLAALAAACGSEGELGEPRAFRTIESREIVRDWLEGKPAWKTLEGRARTDELWPERSGGGPEPMLSLLLPPPGAVEIRAEEGPVLLHGFCGIDDPASEAALEEGLRVRFEVSVNGTTAFLVELEPMSPWVSIGGGSGGESESELELERGDVVVLRTSLLDASGAEVVPTSQVRAGFGKLRFESWRSVPTGPASPERPNIVLVVMDTLRADRLSVYGCERETSPNLERMAAAGTVFDEAFATSSWTWPSTASILTGLSPHAHGVLDARLSYLGTSLESLAEVLSSAGYLTAGWSGNSLIVPGKNFDQGFQSFDASHSVFRSSREFMPAVIAWLRDHAEERFFLYLHLVDPHVPDSVLEEGLERLAKDGPKQFPERGFAYYKNRLLRRGAWTKEGELKKAFRIRPRHQEWIHRLYDAAVWSGDHALGRVLDALAELGLEESTVVAFTSDHGEELFDHGKLGHGHSLHRELVRVPLVLSGPGIPAGKRVAPRVSNRGLAAALARMAGTEMARAETALEWEEVVPEKGLVFSTETGWWKGRRFTTVHGLIEGDWMLHWAPEGGPWGTDEALEKGEYELFRIDRDPRGLENLAALEPARAEAMRRALEDRIAGLEADRRTTTQSAGEGTLQMLRGLGYVEEE